MVASTKVANALLTAKTVGKLSMNSYMHDRINTSAVPLNQTIKQLKLPTFASLTKTKLKKAVNHDKIMVVQKDSELISRLVMISKERDIDLERLFTYELSSTPLSMSINTDGAIAKTNEAYTMRHLEEESDSSIGADQISKLYTLQL